MNLPRDDLLDRENIWGEVSSILPAQILRGKIQEKKQIWMKDNHHHGKLLGNIKEKNILQLYFQNINGGLKKCDWGKLRLALEKLIELKVDVFGFVETILACSPEDREKVKRILSEIPEKQSKCKMSASDDPCVSSSQPGGLMIGVMGNHMGRVLEADYDRSRLGRWRWMCLNGKKTKLYVVSTYQVQKEESDGVNLACTQQKKLLRMNGTSKINSRKQWLTDLAAQIK
eukprot:10212411-Ditylum_brightwellii.AAC.1